MLSAYVKCMQETREIMLSSKFILHVKYQIFFPLVRFRRGEREGLIIV